MSAFEVKKYPDLGRGYEQALARHKEKPSDPSRALRLASLELLKQQPARAIDALDAMPADLKTTNPGQFQTVVHLRVQAMLDSVRQEVAKGDSALKLLRKRGRSRSRRRTDSTAPLRWAITFCTTISRSKRQFNTSRWSPRRKATWSSRPTATGSSRQKAASASSDVLRGIAVQRIVDALKDLNPQQSQELRQRMDEFLAKAASKHDVAGLVWLAESDGLGEPSHRAEVLLGAWAAGELRFEQAESYFLRRCCAFEGAGGAGGSGDAARHPLFGTRRATSARFGRARLRGWKATGRMSRCPRAC